MTGNEGDQARWTELYDELHAIARALVANESRQVTVQPTMLLHEAYVRLANRPKVHDNGTRYFRACCANEFRRVLRDLGVRPHRRLQLTISTGMLAANTDTATDVMDLDAALIELARDHPQHERMAELQIYGGLTTSDIAEHLGCSARTVQRHLRFAAAWLRRWLDTEAGHDAG